MTVKAKPKQRNVYPAILAAVEKKRNRDWLTNPSRIKTNQTFKTGFKQYLRKNPGQ